MIELVREIVPAKRPAGVRPVTARRHGLTPEEAREAIHKEVYIIRQELQGYLGAFLDRYNADANGLKEVRKAIEALSRSQAEHGKQIHGLLKYLGLDPFKAADSSPHPLADGRWRNPSDPELDKPQPVRVPLPIPDLRAKWNATAAKLEAELPGYSENNLSRKALGNA